MVLGLGQDNKACPRLRSRLADLEGFENNARALPLLPCLLCCVPPPRAHAQPTTTPPQHGSKTRHCRARDGQDGHVVGSNRGPFGTIIIIGPAAHTRNRTRRHIRVANTNMRQSYAERGFQKSPQRRSRCMSHLLTLVGGVLIGFYGALHFESSSVG